MGHKLGFVKNLLFVVSNERERRSLEVSEEVFVGLVITENN